MPVDPGNLLLLGRIGGVSVVGLPGCARSRRLNGFDWVLRRLLAGLEIGPAEIARMGVGGLLAETPSRGLPREPRGDPAGPPRVAALVLAAGRASRMGANKLLLDIGGKSLVQRAVEAALQSGAAPVVVVLGHEAAAVRARLADYQVRFVTNPAFADGLSTSLKAGLAALPDDADGVVVCLGDMPDVEGALIARMIAAFNPLEGRGIVVPVRRGRRGNPVLWGRRFLSELTRTTGDTGAKHLIGEYADQIVEIEAGSDGVLLDLDTPESVEAYRARRITG
jgi:molybdenum cofactor cytidylyltransferase